MSSSRCIIGQVFEICANITTCAHTLSPDLERQLESNLPHPLDSFPGITVCIKESVNHPVWAGYAGLSHSLLGVQSGFSAFYSEILLQST